MVVRFRRHRTVRKDHDLSGLCTKSHCMRSLLQLLVTATVSLLGLCRAYVFPKPLLEGYSDLVLSARGRAWSRSDVERLVSLRAQGLALAEIGARLNRSATACKSRYATHRPQIYWSKEKKGAVLSAAVVLGEDWAAIGRETNLAAQHCRIFYLDVLRNQRSDPWTLDDDRRLLELCAVSSGLHQDVLAATSWKNVSHLLNRPSVACRKR